LTDTLHIPLSAAVALAEANGWAFTPGEDAAPPTLSCGGSAFQIDMERPGETKVAVASIVGALLDRPVESIAVRLGPLGRSWS
jgi:hypothetical protein